MFHFVLRFLHTQNMISDCKVTTTVDFLTLDADAGRVSYRRHNDPFDKSLPVIQTLAVENQILDDSMIPLDSIRFQARGSAEA